MPIPAKPTITAPPSPLPTRGENPTTFSNNINALVAWYPDLDNNLNDSIDWMDLVFIEVESEAGAAAQSATDAKTAETGAVAAKNETQTLQENVTSNLNFRGLWDDADPVADEPPASYLHNNTYWQLLVPLANVKSVEPGTDPSTWSVSVGSSMIGDIKAWPQDENPAGWLDLDGTIYTQVAYPDLAARFPPWQRLFDTFDANSPVALGASGNVVFVDDLYVYVGIFASPYLKVYDKTNMSLVAGTPVPAGQVLGIYSDNTTLFVCHATSPYFSAYTISGWGAVGGTPTLAGTGLAMAGDATYLYIVHAGSPYLTVLDKATYAVEAGTPTLPFTSPSDVRVDANSVFVSGNASPYVSRYAIGTWAAERLDVVATAAVSDIAVTDDSVYGCQGETVLVWDKASGVPLSFTLFAPGSGRGVVQDGGYLFVGCNTDPNLVIYDEETRQPIAGAAALANNANSIFVESGKLYAAVAITNELVIIDVSEDATEFRVPRSYSNAGNTKLMVRAE